MPLAGCRGSPGGAGKGLACVVRCGVASAYEVGGEGMVSGVRAVVGTWGSGLGLGVTAVALVISTGSAGIVSVRGENPRLARLVDERVRVLRLVRVQPPQHRTDEPQRPHTVEQPTHWAGGVVLWRRRRG